MTFNNFDSSRCIRFLVHCWRRVRLLSSIEDRGQTDRVRVRVCGMGWVGLGVGLELGLWLGVDLDL